MNILVWLIFGALSGWIAEMVMGSNQTLLQNVILGIVGAFVGGLIMNFFGSPGVTGFNLYSVVVSVIGAAIVIFLGRLFRG